MSSKVRNTLIAAGLINALLCLPAYADETLMLRVAHTYPADHFLWEKAGKLFTQQVTERSNGRVKFEVYPAGQLGKESLGVIEAGLAEIAFIIPSLATDKLPLSEVTQLPSMFDSSCQGASMFHAAGTGDGVLNKREYEPQGIRYLYSYVSPPYSMMTRTKPTATLESLVGQKVRVVGGPMATTVSQLGAVPVTIPSTEMYDSLLRGTIDGTIYSRMALKSLKLEKALKYSVDGVRLGTGNIFVAMSQSAWEEMPDDIKTIIDEASADVEKQLCVWVDEQETIVSKELLDTHGWEIVQLPDDEAARWKERVDHVTAVWAKNLDDASMNGTEVVQQFLNGPAIATTSN